MAIYIGAPDRSLSRHLPVQSDEWTPFALGDALLAWWDAEDRDSLTLSGSNVSGWADRKNGYAPSQSAASSQPTWSAIAFNGRPGVVFDGIDDFLELAPAPLAFPSGANSSEIWVLCKQLTTGTDATIRAIIGYGDNNASRTITRNALGNVNRARVAVGTGTTVPAASDTSVDFSGSHVVQCTFGSADSSVAIDGNSAASVAAVPATTSARVRLGCAVGSSGNYFNGSISAACITSSISVDQRAQLLNYLKKCGEIA